MTIPFEDEPSVATPDLPGEVYVGQTREELLDAIGADVLIHAQLCERKCGDFHLLMTAGPGPEALCVRLMTDPQFRDIPWRKTNVWLAAEAEVEIDDTRSTHKRLADLLVGHSGMPRSNVHAVPWQTGNPQKKYGEKLFKALSRRERGHDRPDCAILSIDPDSSVVAAPAWRPGRADTGAFEAVESDVAGVGGISASPTLLSAARVVAMIGTGESCRGAVAGAVAGAPGSEVWARAEPLAGVMRWYLDEAAVPASAGGGS
ncbi:MAG: 6-phosphogluconolactonase [Planctomycetota bacterium]